MISRRNEISRSYSLFRRFNLNFEKIIHVYIFNLYIFFKNIIFLFFIYIFICFKNMLFFIYLYILKCYVFIFIF